MFDDEYDTVVAAAAADIVDDEDAGPALKRHHSSWFSWVTVGSNHRIGWRSRRYRRSRRTRRTSQVSSSQHFHCRHRILAQNTHHAKFSNQTRLLWQQETMG